MTTHASDTTAFSPAGPQVVVVSLLLGSVLGVFAKLLGSISGPPALLGAGVAAWVTSGFLLSRRAARGRPLIEGAVWGASTMGSFLGAWLLAYCIVFGAQQSAGFGAAWLNERVFFILSPPASGLLGLIASASWRHGWIGDMGVVAPLAWSLPEAGFAAMQGLPYALLVGVPILTIACLPLLRDPKRGRNWVLVAGTIVAGVLLTVLALRVVDGRMF